jgi:succinyl-CoA synthetase alpha subunit
VSATGANTSVIFVPARFAADAILEAADAGIQPVVCITEGIPVMDMVQVRADLDTTHTRLIWPNRPGLITPGEAKVGIIPGHIMSKGNVGLVSRSGTLTYEVVDASTAGSDRAPPLALAASPINGTSFLEVLQNVRTGPQHRTR